MAAPRSVYRPIQRIFLVYFLAFFSFSGQATQNENSKLLPASPSPPTLTIVLDLDETLIFARDRSGLFVRPGVLDWLRKWRTVPGVELVVWTAGLPRYAHSVVEALDSHILPLQDPAAKNRPGSAFAHVITRASGSWYQGESPPKDLSLLGRHMERVVLIDNLASNCRKNTANSLVVVDFEGNETLDHTFTHLDTVLTGVYEHLSQFKESDPVPCGYLGQLLASFTAMNAQLVDIYEANRDQPYEVNRFFGVNTLPVNFEGDGNDYDNDDGGMLLARVNAMRDRHKRSHAMENSASSMPNQPRPSKRNRPTTKITIVSIFIELFSNLPILTSLSRAVTLH